MLRFFSFFFSYKVVIHLSPEQVHCRLTLERRGNTFGEKLIKTTKKTFSRYSATFPINEQTLPHTQKKNWLHHSPDNCNVIWFFCIIFQFWTQNIFYDIYFTIFFHHKRRPFVKETELCNIRRTSLRNIFALFLSIIFILCHRKLSFHIVSTWKKFGPKKFGPNIVLIAWKFFGDGRKAVWSIPYVSVVFFQV